MGLLNQVVGGLAANALGGKGNGLADMAMQLVNQYPGGLGGLVQAFQKGGLGEIANSWVSTGQNLPVSGDQLSSVLGNDFIGKLAGQAGVAPSGDFGELGSGGTVIGRSQGLGSISDASGCSWPLALPVLPRWRRLAPALA